jgi:HTH-type transcriptional regulator/antitoxin HigA
MMDVKPLHNEQDYDWAICEVTSYSRPSPCPEPLMGTFRGPVYAHQEHEDEHFETRHGEPVDVLHFAIESMGKSRARLANLIERNRASEILNRVRPVTWK